MHDAVALFPYGVKLPGLILRKMKMMAYFMDQLSQRAAHFPFIQVFQFFVGHPLALRHLGQQDQIDQLLFQRLPVVYGQSIISEQLSGMFPVQHGALRNVRVRHEWPLSYPWIRSAGIDDSYIVTKPEATFKL
ncbi:hypothetical protein D1872_286860 [compost metagenome]